MRIFLTLSILFVLSCSGSEEKQSEQPFVLGTTGMIADMAKNILGDIAQVEGLMGPGVDPHLYKANQGDLLKLRKAQVVLYNGLHLEGKMAEVLEKMAEEKPVFAISDGIEKAELRIVDSLGRVYDPHIWFDVALWAKACKYVGERLALAFPEHASEIQANTAAYLDSLAALDTFVHTALASIPEKDRLLVTAHDAFGYFGDAYGIEVHALQGISTVSEFGLQDVTQLVNLIVAKKVKAIFIETSISPKSIQAVIEGCKRKNHQVKPGGSLYSDAMGETGSPAGNFIGMVKSNVRTIESSLR